MKLEELIDLRPNWKSPTISKQAGGSFIRRLKYQPSGRDLGHDELHDAQNLVLERSKRDSRLDGVPFRSNRLSGLSGTFGEVDNSRYMSKS